MKKLTKSQKATIILSILWVVIAFINSDMNKRCGRGYCNQFSKGQFLALSSPIILYWSIVWIWGFGHLLRFIKKIKSNIIKLLIIVVLAVFTYVLTNEFGGKIIEAPKPSSEFTFTPEPTPEDNARIDKYGHLYGVYYGAVEFPSKYCTNNGYIMANIEKFKTKHKDKIDEINQQLNSIESIKGFRQSKKFTDIDKKALEEILQLRSFLILDKLSKEDSNFNPNPNNIKNIIRNNQNKISIIETCQFLDENFNDFIKNVDWNGFIIP